MFFRSLAAFFVLVVAIPCNALLLTATPTLAPEKAESVYKPIAELLAESLGVPVEFEYTDDWQKFSYNVLASEYDLIMAEPHIIAYVSSPDSNLSMNVPIKLDATTRFHVVVRSNSPYKTLKDLGSARICMRPSPNFSGVMIKREFSNPVIQPVVIEIKGGFDAVYSYFKKKRCHAAVINENTYQQLKKSGEVIRSVHETLDSPSLALAISQRVSSNDKKVISDTLINRENALFIEPLVEQYTEKKAPFVKTQFSEFESFNILPGVVWGW